MKKFLLVMVLSLLWNINTYAVEKKKTLTVVQEINKLGIFSDFEMDFAAQIRKRSRKKNIYLKISLLKSFHPKIKNQPANSYYCKNV